MPDFGPNWKYVRDLAEGGQAHTFLVVSTTDPTETQYVLKRLKNLERRERFGREVRACMALNHPNILRINAYGEAKGKPFLVSEYCSGGSLSDQKKPLGGPLEILSMFKTICEGVMFAHTNNIVHRDIKPDNIFLRSDGTPVLGDFGICYIDEDGACLTATEEVVGSRWYCAPELQNGRVDNMTSPTAADVYSLGKVLYWMMSNGRIFSREEHRTDAFLLGKNRFGSPEYELVHQLLDKMIVADPHKRWNVHRVYYEVERMIRVVSMGGHAIALNAKQWCSFCASGNYRVVVDGVTSGNPLKAREEAQNQFGLAAAAAGAARNPMWLIMVCENCGHVQLFRPDLSQKGIENWQR